MGLGTPIAVAKDSVGRRKDARPARQHGTHLSIDIWLLLAVITLCIFGLVMVYSASTDYSMVVLDKDPNYMFLRQMIFMVLGVVVAVSLSLINYHTYTKIAVILMLVTLAGLIVVLVVNNVVNNAARTLYQGSIQPSELAKLVMIIYLAVWLYARREQLSDVWFGLIPLGIMLGVLGFLILLQPDISATATIILLGGMMFFLAGGELRQIAFLMGIGLIAGWLLFRFSATGNQRFTDYLISIRDLTQAPMHLARSLEALVRGGWLGVGIGRAETKLTGLPVPPTDSIFAVVAEELGILGASFLVILFAIILWRGLAIAQKAPDGLGKLLAAGLTLWITVEALINMAVIVGLVPFAGNALPFISYGGSNLVVSMAAIGILMNISRVSAYHREEDEKKFDAVVDLRRRDRRWRVPGSSGAQGTTKT